MDDPSTAQTRSRIRELVATLNERDFSRLDALFHEDVVFHAPLAMQPSRGLALVRAFYEAQGRAVPDLRMRIAEMAVEGERAAVRSILSGTHGGELAGFPASGRSFDGVDDCVWYRFEGGRVAELFILPTSGQMLEALHLMPGGPPSGLLAWLIGLRVKATRGVPAAPLPLPAAKVELRAEDHAAEKFLIRKGLLEFFSGRKVELYDELFTQDCTLVSRADQVAGKAAILALCRKIQTGLPDLHFTVEDIVVDGPLVGTRVTARGTNLGPLEGLPPTGRRYAATEVFLEVVEGGRVKHQWHAVNFEAMLLQLGLAPPGPPPLPMRLLMRFLARRQEKREKH